MCTVYGQCFLIFLIFENKIQCWKNVRNYVTNTAKNIKNNVMSGHEIIVTKNGHEVGRFIPKDAAVSYLTDSLTGILQDNGNLDEIKTESMREKYGFVD